MLLHDQEKSMNAQRRYSCTKPEVEVLRVMRRTVLAHDTHRRDLRFQQFSKVETRLRDVEIEGIRRRGSVDNVLHLASSPFVFLVPLSQSTL